MVPDIHQEGKKGFSPHIIFSEKHASFPNIIPNITWGKQEKIGLDFILIRGVSLGTSSLHVGHIWAGFNFPSVPKQRTSRFVIHLLRRTRGVVRLKAVSGQTHKDESDSLSRCCFPLVAFPIFSLLLVFRCLIMLYLGMSFFGFV